MNKELLQKTINRLNEIKKGLNIDVNKGICFNLTYTLIDNKNDYKYIALYIHGLSSWLRNQLAQWPECAKRMDGTKDVFLPVRGLLGFDNPKRLELLDFLIEQANNQLKEMNKEQHHE